jgi:hypothetical protein
VALLVPKGERWEAREEGRGKREEGREERERERGEGTGERVMVQYHPLRRTCIPRYI